MNNDGVAALRRFKNIFTLAFGVEEILFEILGMADKLIGVRAILSPF